MNQLFVNRDIITILTLHR